MFRGVCYLAGVFLSLFNVYVFILQLLIIKAGPRKYCSLRQRTSLEAESYFDTGYGTVAATELDKSSLGKQCTVDWVAQAAVTSNISPSPSILPNGSTAASYCSALHVGQFKDST